MSPRPFARMIGAALLAALPAAGTPVDQSLGVRSPFLPSAAEVAASEPAPPLEFTGYIAAADNVQYRINDPSRKTGAWVKLNQPDPESGLVAKRHDVERDLLFVEHQGRPLTLPMRHSKIRPAGMPNAPFGVAPPPAVVNPTSVDQQKQLETLAAAVAQRRAAREQAPPLAGSNGKK
jgi:hypothetical protein